jgi:hypothetical protein
MLCSSAVAQSVQSKFHSMGSRNVGQFGQRVPQTRRLWNADIRGYIESP